MDTKLDALESLLVELFELGAAVEEKGVTSRLSLGPLVEKAEYLGLPVTSSTSLDDLCSAVENACAHARATYGQPDGGDHHPLTAKDILGNEAGIPGDGP
jgi:hypothetical protein